MKQCIILECRHNQQEGCRYQNCYFLTDKALDANYFESVLGERDYQNTFYIKKYNAIGRPYRIPQRGKVMEFEFARLCTSDNMKMNGARLFDLRTGEFVCYADELNDLADIRKIIESMVEMPDIIGLPTGD